jgi:quercetin dioxygenase-like cupin family protein
MPFYVIDEMKKGKGGVNPNMVVQAAAGEFMKVAVVTKPEGEGPPLHEHPNEEQWSLILEGEMHFILDGEERIVTKGDLVHIPRNVQHRSRPINGPATFFTVKSPVGTGKMDQDYNLAANAEEAEKGYPGKAKAKA